jgi:polyhydroxyalkanoate synthesis regulator phasin
MLIKINKEGDKIIDLSVSSDEPRPEPKPKPIPKPIRLNADRAKEAAAGAAALEASIGHSGGGESDNMPNPLYYNPKLIKELNRKIDNLKNKIKELNNRTATSANSAESAAININQTDLDTTTNLAIQYFEEMKILKLKIDDLENEIKKIENAPKLSADKAKIAANNAKKILEEILKSDKKNNETSDPKQVTSTGGNYYDKYIKYRNKYLELKAKYN